MDSEGIAIRMEKQWACRQSERPTLSEPLLLEPAAYREFRGRRLALGDWDNWICDIRPGPIIYSREIQKAQAAMNTIPGKPDCAPLVPENGRLNWEMLDYARCYIAKDVQQARETYEAAVTARLSELLREGGNDPERVRARAKETELLRPREGCGKTLRTMFDFAVCELDACERHLIKAEGIFTEYGRRIDKLRDAPTITQSQTDGIAADADLIREVLRRAEREAHGI